MSFAPERDVGAAALSTGASLLPVRILSAVAVLLVLFIIFAPQQTSDAGTMYSSYATGAGGTRALYDVLKRVGFTMGRNEKALSTEPDSNSTYVIFNPAQPLTSTEETRLLAAVRRGAILVFTVDDDALADSLGFETTTPAGGFFTLGRTVVAGGNPPAPAGQDPSDVIPAALTQ